MRSFDSPDEAAFRAEARSWLEGHARLLDGERVSPSAIVVEWSPDEEAERLAEAQHWQRVKYDAGWAGIAMPVAYGGRGGTAAEHLIFSQEERRFDVPHDALVVGLGWCAPALLAHGSEELRDRLLPPLLRGDEIWCQLFSEPGAGSDLAGLRTAARRDGDEWVLDGQKVWTTFAHRADWGLCIARHDPSLPKHRGMTAFVVDMRSAGLGCRPLRQMTDSANFDEVFLDGVRVPDRYRVGEPGEGWRVVTTTFMFERMTASFAVLDVLGALRRLLREHGGDAVLRDRYVALYARARAFQATGLRLLTSLSRRGAPGPEGSIVKLEATLLLSEVYELALDVLGQRGLLVGAAAPAAGDWAAAFLGSPGLRIGGGTDQIQRSIIGERILGLPPEPRADKGVPFRAIPRSA